MQIKKIKWDYFEERKPDKPIKHLVVHCFAFPVDKILDIWKDFKVGSHYLIDERGKIFQFVDENKTAYHVGKSFWRGEESLNFSSIGIELYSQSFGQELYPTEQIEAFKELASDIIKRYDIKPENVIGHSDIAPTRKVDPGKAFPWKDLAQNGIGFWPKEKNPDVFKDKTIKELLSIIGYDVSNEKAALFAFLRHFMPEKVAYEKDVIHMENTLPDRIKNCQPADDEIKTFLENMAFSYHQLNTDK